MLHRNFTDGIQINKSHNQLNTTLDGDISSLQLRGAALCFFLFILFCRLHVRFGSSILLMLSSMEYFPTWLSRWNDTAIFMDNTCLFVHLLSHGCIPTRPFYAMFQMYALWDVESINHTILWFCVMNFYDGNSLSIYTPFEAKGNYIE